MNERSIFAAALDISDPAERAACLDKACVQQPELRQQLDELLAAQRNRTALTATLIVAASLVLGAVLATWQAVRELAAEGQATTAQVQAESERDRALSARRRASESLQYSLEENKRTGTATAEVGAERGKKEDFLKRTIVLDRLLSAMHAEHQGSVEAAERLYRNALEYAQKELGLEGAQTCYATLALAEFYNRMNTLGKSEPPIRKFYEFYKLRHEDSHTAKSDEELVGAEYFDEAYVRALDLLGSNLLEQHKWADAELFLRRDVALREKLVFPQSNTISANARFMLGASLVGQKRYAEAEPLLHRACEGLTDTTNVAAFGTYSRDMFMPTLLQTIERIVQMYEGWGKVVAKMIFVTVCFLIASNCLRHLAASSGLG